MRKIIISSVVAIVLVGAYTGGWFYSSKKLENNVISTISNLKAKGYHISYDSFKVGGFPFSITAKLNNLSIKRTDYFRTWFDGEIKFTSTIFNPGRISSVAGGENHLEFGYDGKVIAVQGQGFEVVNATFDGSDAGIKYKKLSINIGGEPVLQAEGVSYQLTKLRDTNEGPTYDFKAEMKAIKSPYLTLLSLGSTIQHLTIAANITGDMEGVTLLERLESWSKKGGSVDVAKFDVLWGDLHIGGNGTFLLDDDLQPTASMAIKISGVDALLKTMVAEKVIDKNMAKAVKVGVQFFSVQDEESNQVISVTIQDNKLSIGPVVLFKIPKVRIK